MRILAIGDFHGKFPEKLMRKIRKEKFDLIVSPGDFGGNKKWEKIFWKYVYGTELSMEDVIGKEKVNELEKQSFESGKKVLRKLVKLNKKIIAVRGNWDPQDLNDIGFPNHKDAYSKQFLYFTKKFNIKIIDFKKYKFQGVRFIGYPRSTYPGKVNKHITKKFEGKYGKEAKKIFIRINKDNKKYFLKFKKLIDKNSIFISHNCLYRTKLDKIQKGKHYGSYLAKKVVEKFKPFLVICGHMHENQGKQKIGKTWIVNTGAGIDGKAAIIGIDSKKKKVKSIELLR